MNNPNKLSVKKIRLFIKHHFTDQPTNFPEQDHDMGIIPLDFTLGKFYTELLSFKKSFSIRQIEEIRYKDEKYPIYEIDINPNAKKKLFILSGTHGNEQAGIASILVLLNDIIKHPSFYKDVHILILTPHNPVGAKYFSRFNGEGRDLNRDFKKIKAAETRTVINSMKRFGQDFTLSLHEGPQTNGVFLFCNKFVREEFALKVLQYAKGQGVSFATKNYFNKTLVIPGYSPINGFMFFLMKLWSGLLGLQPEGYYVGLQSIPNITVETPWREKNTTKRIQGHVAVIKGVVAQLSILKKVMQEAAKHPGLI